ncbi:hypothetical protein STRIP9103_07347, partial [Streptomyces ipomoeae 91-03]
MKPTGTRTSHGGGEAHRDQCVAQGGGARR